MPNQARDPRAALDSALDRSAPATDVIPIVEELLSDSRLEDITRLDRVLSKTSLNEQQRTMVREIRRRIQERECQIEDINREEEELIRAGLPRPKDAASKWIAVRLGKLVAEGPDRGAVMAKLREKQRGDQPIIALSVPLDQVPRLVGRSGARFHAGSPVAKKARTVRTSG